MEKEESTIKPFNLASKLTQANNRLAGKKRDTNYRMTQEMNILFPIESLRTKGESQRAYHKLGMALIDMGKLRSGARMLEKSLSEKFDEGRDHDRGAEALNYLGTVYARLERKYEQEENKEEQEKYGARIREFIAAGLI